MKTVKTLPEDFVQVFSADMKNNKKLALRLNLAAVVICLLIAVPMHFVVPVTELFSMERGLGMYILRFAVVVAANIAYIVIHELVHGRVMKICGAGKLNFGFNGIFAWAGCKDEYFSKGQYISVALGPLVLLGVLLAVGSGLCAVLAPEWFWVVYPVQIANVTGAVGDVYVSSRVLGLPSETLIHDNGLTMTAFARR